MPVRIVSRRTFGKLVGAAGAGAAGAGTLLAAPAHAADGWVATGTAVAALSSFDDTMKSFMQARGVSAGQLAVAYNGRLVLARGYGNNSAETVQPTSLFRVASLSKSLTAAAVLRLAQDGLVGLDDPVTSVLDFIPPPGQSVDPRLPQVTLRRLLQHLGGWDRDLAFDPLHGRDHVIAQALGVPLELRKEDLLRYMSGQPLQHDPGSTVAYSNYGYFLAGRVVEKVTGMSYEAYVKQKLLAPLGVTRMAHGKALTPLANEVSYRSQYTGRTVLDDSGTIVPAPYGTFSMSLRDANGGWVASAVDMVRWATMLDGAGGVLDSASLAKVTAVPATGVNSNGWYYGLGWAVRPFTTSTGTRHNIWHTGSLPGTYTLLVKSYQGMSWAALFNQRDDPSGLSYGDIDSALWAASRQVTNWPTHNLWSTYFTPWSAVVDNTTAGRFTASTNWTVSSSLAGRYGTNYRRAAPVAASDVAWYKVDVPETGTYRVEVWYPASTGNSAATPYIVATSTGNKTVHVDQRSNGGKWRSLGTFTLVKGDGNKVGVSRWTSGTGYVVADAVRVTRV